MPSTTATADALPFIRRILLITVVFGMIGIELELFLLGHLKPVMQLIPVVLMAVGLASIAGYALSPGGKSIKVFQAIMVLCIGTGLLGIFVHLGFSASEAQKKDKTLQGMKLIRTALTGVAPPFAPAALIQIGLVGLAYTFRHPALTESSDRVVS